MAKKAELEHVYNQYRHSCAVAIGAVSAGDFQTGIREAESSLSHVYPTITYQKRFLKTEPDAPTLDVLLRYAPPLFLGQAIDAVERWYLSGTRTERGNLPDVSERIASARSRATLARELWSVLDAAPDAHLAVSNRNPAELEIVRTWLRLGAVAPSARYGPQQYERVSDPRRSACGRCSGCGYTITATLSRLLDPFPCPGCRREHPFVLLRYTA